MNTIPHNRNIKLLREVWDGIDFVMEMLAHNGPALPRTILTGASHKPHVVNSRDEAMMYFEASLYEDCYMNAYPNYDAMIKISGTTPGYKPIPNHIMIDLDKEPFNSDADLQTALDDTLRNIKSSITGISGEYPIVIASGSGGYHIHVPIPGLIIPLQDMPEFEAFKHDADLANKFLRFAERRLTNNKADPKHNPSVNSCLFRIPGSINSKAKAKVKIVKGLEYVLHRIAEEQSIPGDYYTDAVASRPTTKFLNDFYAHLVQQQMNDKITRSDRRIRRSLIREKLGSEQISYDNSIWWIDRLLSIGVEDGRKDLLYWVLAPYLITVRKMDYDKATHILGAWLDRCYDVRRLEPDHNYFRHRIRYCLDKAESKERLPLKFETFQEYYSEVCERVLQQQQ